MYVLNHAQVWGVAPWDLVCPESKGYEFWLLWMHWAGDLLKLRKTVLHNKAEREKELAAVRRPQRRRRRRR